jgi:Uma2 family endonuclease
MNLIPPPLSRNEIVYPESDGEPLADNTKQLQWIFILFGNLAALFREIVDIFVGSNQLWYPVEGRPDIVTAPDVYVVFGRPKHHRSSYKQWLEDHIPLTVVFEIMSPGNDYYEMANKLAFNEDHGVEEYYVYDPETNRLLVFQRKGEVLRRIRPVDGYISPKLGIRFDLSGEEMVVYHPDGRRFLTFEELTDQFEAEQRRAEQALQKASRMTDQYEAEQRLRQAAEHRASRLAELSRKARRGSASADELAELDRLEESPLE